MKGSQYTRSVRNFDKNLGKVEIKKAQNIVSVVRGKDNDFMRKEKQIRLKCSPLDVFDQIQKDIQLLSRLGLVDYSILYTVTEHKGQSPKDIGFCEKYYHFDVGTQEAASLYIIDYFQSFDNYKQWESLLKQFFFGPKCNFSVIDSVNYGLRLSNFIRNALGIKREEPLSHKTH